MEFKFSPKSTNQAAHRVANKARIQKESYVWSGTRPPDHLNYSKAGPSLWNFVLLAPDIGVYIAIDFSPNGRMISSSAMAGWVSSSVGVAKHYSLDGYTSIECPPDQGSLPLVKGSSLLVLQISQLYLVYADGPSNTSPSTGGYLPAHRNMASGTLSAPAAGGRGECTH
ncbi:hypothetical protein Cni_G13360 [Canna indica]|uniref:DOMON domain-containing protein n=1 Tax=Canna indica TaxID=4628 RepID=A0AAQ3K9E2_9LILI|nr:hypothetical protein Cni_G13360 [Canna indica]